MQIDIYKSTKNGNKYLSVPVGTKVTELNLPEDIDPDILTLSPFKTRVKLDPNKPRVALDQEDVIRQIEKNGYAVHAAKIEITIGAGSSPRK
ncbi:MAG: hypothetical protein APR62_12480 [Smithella sp. SDB]|nr:MAG: hypothetical protein APR62_12480 [Smithella sp. SDB]